MSVLRLRLGLGPPFASTNEPPTGMSLSSNSADEDLAVGMTIGLLSTTDPDAGDSFTYTILTDPDSKFSISENELILADTLDFETAESHNVSIRSTDSGGATVDESFVISVIDVDEGAEDPEFPTDTSEIIHSDNFEVDPTVSNSNGKGKIQGKSNDEAIILVDIGQATADTTYTMRYDPNFTLMSQQGSLAFVGFGLLDGNSYHMSGLKGDGSDGLNIHRLEGTNFNNVKQATHTDGGVASHGTQAGPNWIQYYVHEDGSAYTMRTGTSETDDPPETWTDEFTEEIPTPLDDVTSPASFGVGVFLDAEDKGSFSIEVTVWKAIAPLAFTLSNDSVAQDASTDTTIGTFIGEGGESPYTYEILEEA